MLKQTCARILLPPTDRATYLRRFRRPGIESLQRQHAIKLVLAECKKVSKCPYCYAPNGIVKKNGPMKISHEPYRGTKNAEAKAEYIDKFKVVLSENRGIGNHMDKIVEDLNPLKALELFKRVSAEVCTISLALGVDRRVSIGWAGAGM